MENLIVMGVIAAIIGCAIGYVIGKKRKGAVCIGCPHAGSCGGGCGGSCH